MLVSFIVPVLNEVHTIEKCITELPLQANKFGIATECILADGGSTDGTQQVLERVCGQFGSDRLRWIQTGKGRAVQMNAASRLAHGEWLVFLHADTTLPHSSFEQFLAEISEQGNTLNAVPRLTAGAFTFRVAHERRVYRYLEWYVAKRCRTLKLPFGDQAIFALKEVFMRLGGYREDFPLMEDMAFVLKANKDAGFRVLDAPVFTSARRYEQEGYWKRAAGNVYLQVLFRLGVHPKRLAAMYYK